MTRRARRLTLIGTALCVFGVAVGLVLFALRDNIVFFYSPAEIEARHIAPGTRLRIGGLVEQGSFKRDQGRVVSFVVTDGKGSLPVTFSGLLPDLFREGQGIVAEGRLDQSGTFRADNVLAKHDERYMPREVADALKKQGVWQGGNNSASTQGLTR
ncbi:MAG: cytochrome c-type biosis protein CcmE [Methylobacteriaceae bacterium]|jgi:cytochrome c-type biogenesis protein CcmE|nr:cytochrome c-type biosis protein CcmE [Methylobacteriaceae bacterium]